MLILMEEIIELQKWVHIQTQLIAKNYIINRFKFLQMNFEGLNEKKIEGLKFIGSDVASVTEEELMRSIAKYYPHCNRNVLRIYLPTIATRITSMVQKTIKTLEDNSKDS